MIELFSFLFGLGFSILVYYRSFKSHTAPFWEKTVSVVFTFIGITGTLFLSGVLIAHFLRRLGVIGPN